MALHCTGDERQALEHLLATLAAVRAAVQMPVPPQGYQVDLPTAGPFLGRLQYLRRKGDPDPVAVLDAVIVAKVFAQSQHGDERHHRGDFATGKAICRPRRWPGNLVAGRSLLARADGCTGLDALIAAAKAGDREGHAPRLAEPPAMRVDARREPLTSIPDADIPH